jgi:hypothetical protein
MLFPVGFFTKSAKISDKINMNNKKWANPLV